MGLRDYELPTMTVNIDAANSFDVRGIAFEDITRLVNKHGPVCVMIYTKFQQTKGEIGLRPESVGQLLSMAMGQFPEAVAELIAMAAGEPDMAAKVQRLPIGVQLDAIEKIIALTFSGEADVKKLVETVTRMAEGVTTSLQSLQTASANGSGGFVSR
ncbi:hypothetical protein [uncultured Brevundimonas sp.]|jgi:hypothetical protein|uniref:phage pre-tape measure protein n=1 Tax=uncultured Brevundimonas sp. TaxID=213418 RepID=UPI00262AEC60|nr:hypothetical protein [uncultured Brevundimonas sp.]HRJ64404.1 hypothetical protein [Brevundimonas sp.]